MAMSPKKLQEKIELLESLKFDKDAIESQIKGVQSEIMDALDEMNAKTYAVEYDNRTIKVTKVQSVRTTIDESSLKRVLGEKLWMKVSTRILDKKKLEAFVASGEVDPMTVAECSTESESAPYIKLT